MRFLSSLSSACEFLNPFGNGDEARFRVATTLKGDVWSSMVKVWIWTRWWRRLHCIRGNDYMQGRNSYMISLAGIPTQKRAWSAFNRMGEVTDAIFVFEIRVKQYVPHRGCEFSPWFGCFWLREAFLIWKFALGLTTCHYQGCYFCYNCQRL